MLGFSASRDTALTHPPFPEVAAPNSLKYPYAANESLYMPLPRAPVSDTAATPAISAPPPSPPPLLPTESSESIFQLPPSGQAPIRVLIQEGADSKWTVSAHTDMLVLWRKPDGNAGKEAFSKGTLQIERDGEGFKITDSKWGEIFVDASSIRLSPANPVVPLQLNGKPYRGSLDFYADATGSQCVNALGMEEYLRGVVPLEMGQPREKAMEALKAQAVVARTYAFKSMLAENNKVFDIRASTQDQVYGGVSAEYDLGDSAVRATRGHVLLHADTLAMCYYHSTCAGMTAARNEVWNGPVIPYLISVPDTDPQGQPWCNVSRHMQWEQSWSISDLAVILHKNLEAAGLAPVPSFQNLTGFRVRDRFSDGRINILEVSTDQGSFELHGDKIRVAFKSSLDNARILRSSRFDILTLGDSVVVRGSGNGHGIGMCQMGALGRSAAGQNYAMILAAYYPGTVLAIAR